ncbi:hypothetical protein M758_UG255500 [Ceratodon purpureus]|nr:hypothetical protein M758_UG255500 [Ceratodon purpureus]
MESVDVGKVGGIVLAHVDVCTGYVILCSQVLIYGRRENVGFCLEMVLNGLQEFSNARRSDKHFVELSMVFLNWSFRCSLDWLRELIVADLAIQSGFSDSTPPLTLDSFTLRPW